MMIIATFENSTFIELAISAIEQEGISKENIFAAPLDKRNNPKQLIDTIHRADGVSLFDTAAILGTCGMLLGAIYGYILTWGPIIWGIIGSLSGIIIGLAIKFILFKTGKLGNQKITSEIVLMIRCERKRLESIENILWDNMALGVTKVQK
ncbi:hypothetical protein [Salirhabdus salicampi]|uniref:hypothetical protein n=1 Tax=Salirhabdus salicampi TaxID=476102 RepID=UPI0020C2C3A9|nr:hypothetical protein [Salirhabdus salicampi]MCP8615396.1 hypothetical protein [Salirhabdus salicampi]